MLGQIFLIVCIATAKSLVSTLETEESAGDAKVIVKGIVGQSASLPCHIDQDNCGEVYFVTWTKLERDDSWLRIYIFADNVEKPLRDLSGRARFSLQKNEAQLTINQLKNGDESLYKCDVTYVAGKCPSLTFVRLEIIAKPSKASIEYQNSQVENGSQIAGVEGDLMRLVCIVIGGKPSPVVSWRTIDNEANTKTIEVKNSSFADNMTTIVLTKELTRTDLNSKYVCHVEHEAIKNNSMDSYVMIDVSVGAQSIEIIGPSDHIKEGDVAVIQCIAYSSKPEAEILWKNGSQIIDTKVKSEVEGNSDGLTINTRSYLELVVSRFDHLNTIECQAINIAMKQPISQSIELRIQYPPIVVMEPQNGLIVNESSDMVNIYCTFNSNPTELIENATLWYKDDQLLLLNDSAHYISQLSGYPILTIVNLTRNDSGSYYCTLSNSIGVGKPEAGVLLNVLYPPVVNLQIYPNPSQGFTIKEGEDVRMICDIIDGNPLNASKVKWMKNSGELVNELDGESTSQKEITWLSVSRSLTGNYTCLAVSDAGQSLLSNIVEIDVSYAPSKALIRQLNGIYAIKGQNLTLECIVSDLGKPSIDTQFLWENPDGMRYETKEPILHLTDIKLTHRGNISCAAVNEVGIGPKGTFEIMPFAAPQIIDSLPPTIGVNENIAKKEVVGVEDTISASCRIECFPICHINWYRNNELIENVSQFYQIKNSIHPEEFLLNRFVSAVSTLIWNMSALAPLDRDRDSNVKYSCVSSDNVVGPSVQSEIQFLVEYPPENLRLKPKRVDVIEYDIPPEILCESDALPAATYRWLSSSFLDKFIGFIADTPLLSLNRSIERDRAGTYTCIASNRHGEDRIDLIIDVLFSPTCIIYESRSGKDEQDIVLICEATSANPNNDLTFNWFLNNSTLNETTYDQIVNNEGLKSKIIIPTIDDNLFGTWTCSVSNSVGESDPNCTLFVSAPIGIYDSTLLGDESIIVISSIIAAIIITFIVILLVLICLMRRRRHKQGSHSQVSQTRENPDGSRSPTPSSVSSHLSSNQVITYKKVETNPRLKRNDKVIDVSKNDIMAARKLPTNQAEVGNREMYENMPFQRKNCMLLSGAFMPQSENIAQITRELRRTQSARFHNYQTTGPNIYSICERNVVYADLQLNTNPFGMEIDEFLYADMYDDVKSGKVADPRIKPPLPPKGDSTKIKPPKRPPKTQKEKN